MPVPVISVAQMRHWEQASWDAGIAQSEVIKTAGQAVADYALKLTRAGNRIVILAGKGHNGDDARCAQPHLTGRQTQILDVKDPAKALAEFEALAKKKPNLLIDGLFGIGLSRPLDGAWTELIESI